MLKQISGVASLLILYFNTSKNLNILNELNTHCYDVKLRLVLQSAGKGKRIFKSHKNNEKKISFFYIIDDSNT